MLTNTAPRRILLGVMFLLLWVPAAVKLLAPLAQSVVAEMAGGDVAPGQRPCLSNHCDFIMFWSAGMLAAHGEADIVYDQDKLLAWEQAHVLPLARVPYLYPPTNFLVTAGFGLLPFEWAYLLWNVLLIGAGVGLLRFAGVSWFVIGTGIVSVPDLFSLRLGHFGFFIGAVVLSGIICAGRKPNAAGALFGLLCIKPQAALLAPIILLARLQWRALLTGGAVVAGMCGAAAALFGVASWRAYFANGIDSTRVVLVEPLNSTGISIFWMLRSLDFGVPASFDGQAFAALLAAGGCFYIWRRKQAAPEARTAITVFLMLLTSPYGYINDMCGYCMAVALLAEAEGRITLFDMLLWLAPAICMNVGESAHIILAPIAVFLAIYRTVRGLQPAPVRLPRYSDE